MKKRYSNYFQNRLLRDNLPRYLIKICSIVDHFLQRILQSANIDCVNDHQIARKRWSTIHIVVDIKRLACANNMLIASYTSIITTKVV